VVSVARWSEFDELLSDVNKSLQQCFSTQTVIYLAARTSSIPSVSSSSSAAFSPENPYSVHRYRHDPLYSYRDHLASSRCFTNVLTHGTSNRSPPRPRNPPAVPYPLGLVPHHAYCFRKSAIDAETDATCALCGPTHPEMQYGHIFEHSQHQDLKFPRTSRPTAPSSATVTSPLNLSASDHFHTVGADAHHRLGDEWQLLPVPYALPSFSFSGHRCLRTLARHSLRQSP
jgi:hypothetical protein